MAIGKVLTGRELGAEKPSAQCHIKTPVVAPWDLPSLSLGQLPQVQVDPHPSPG